MSLGSRRLATCSTHGLFRFGKSSGNENTCVTPHDSSSPSYAVRFADRASVSAYEVWDFSILNGFKTLCVHLSYLVKVSNTGSPAHQAEYFHRGGLITFTCNKDDYLKGRV